MRKQNDVILCSVYVTNIPNSECREDYLRRNTMFGRFGRIHSCVTKGDSAYITYNKVNEAEVRENIFQKIKIN